MNCRTVILALLLWPLGALHAAGAQKPVAARPNLVFVFSNPQSFDMLGCAGNKEIITPNLDKFAVEGVRFTQHISRSPVCTPFRCLLLTGQHWLRIGAFFYNAFRNPQLLIAAGRTSGGVDFRPWPDNWDIVAMLGKKTEYEKNWDDNVVINNFNALPNAKMAIYFDCGVNDFFLGVNRALHKKMTDIKIVHSYEEFPGGRTQDYWGRLLPKHVELFSKHLATEK